MAILERIKNNIEIDFADIIDEIEISEVNEMRIILKDETFIDVWFSLKLPGRFAYHWERRFKDDTIYRHDNVPHRKWNKVKTFPKHFHESTESNVGESHISEDIQKGVVEFLQFVRKKLNQI
jgi:hypothetical protein